MARTQFIFIDYENVSGSDLSRITGKDVRVFIILGTRHQKLPTALILFAQDHADQVRFLQTPVDGRNALDFVLTLELGRQIATHQEGYFHIISKDTDFDSVVRHLSGEGKFIARRSSLTDIPALRTTDERLAAIKAELADATKPRPSTRKKLENKISSAFQHNVEPAYIEKAIQSFVQSGLIVFTGTDHISYQAA